MSDEHTTQGSDEELPDSVGGFQFGVTDGGDETTDGDRPRRTDGAGGTGTRFDFDEWLSDGPTRNAKHGVGSNAPDPAAEASDASDVLDESATARTKRFGGFDFDTWLEETEARVSTLEDDPTETAANPLEETGSVYGGFDFKTWLDDDGVEGPREPPETPRVVGAAPTTTVPLRTRVAAALPFVGPSTLEVDEDDRFDFDAWLSEGETEATEPVSPPAEPVDAGATVGGEGGFPTPPAGGGLSDAPPIKLAAFALFAASIVAVALTAGGAIPALGPAQGFGAVGAGEDTEVTATPTPTPEPTPTPTPEPTPTPTPEPTPTPTPEPDDDDDDDDDGGLLDPVLGGSSDDGGLVGGLL